MPMNRVGFGLNVLSHFMGQDRFDAAQHRRQNTRATGLLPPVSLFERCHQYGGGGREQDHAAANQAKECAQGSIHRAQADGFN